MNDIAIIAEGLGKKYNIGSNKSTDLRTSLSNIFSKINSQKEGFWALSDVNFELKHGEAVGIIGRNGAGKSTLLKILSRITKPTTGKVEINGRVSSLLEVGTGFHPELTGKENIYLNGTILGMSRREIQSKFNDIVNFSGIAGFINTPVKHYSSGMKVRLAFSVAAHLEPEILIIDEVLAVGDAEFQKKCFGKMNDITGKGRTVLLVSHNMNAISQLCSRGILLNNGSIIFQGTSDKTIDKYYNLLQNEVENVNNKARENPDYGKSIRIIDLKLVDDNRSPIDSIAFGEPVRIHLTLNNLSGKLSEKLQLVIGLNSIFQERLITLTVPYIITLDGNSSKVFEISFDANLSPGVYNFTLNVTNELKNGKGDSVDRVSFVNQFIIVDYISAVDLIKFNSVKTGFISTTNCNFHEVL